MKKFLQMLGIGALLSALSVFVANMAGWDFEFTWLEYFAVATSYTCTLLFVHQSRWCYPIGVLTTFLYSILFWNWGMPAMAIFNLYMVFSLMYGYWRWGPDSNPIPVTSLKMDKWLFGYVGLGALIYVLLIGAVALIQHFGLQAEELATLDIYAAVLSGLAQILLDNKKIQNWPVWAVVNVLTIAMTWHAGLYLVCFQYIFFLGNTIYGWVEWHKSMKGAAT